MTIPLLVNLKLSAGLTHEEVQQLVENVATAIVNMAEFSGITPDESDAHLERVEVQDAVKEIFPVVYQSEGGKYVKKG